MFASAVKDVLKSKPPIFSAAEAATQIHAICKKDNQNLVKMSRNCLAFMGFVLNLKFRKYKQKNILYSGKDFGVSCLSALVSI